mmetsp:Transcript_22014/g.45641  ORF Transcript_22014/g.45641 Transcript_22014/m.45641 type:complete len:109 (+) Transcript_22014:144-470(+)
MTYTVAPALLVMIRLTCSIVMEPSDKQLRVDTCARGGARCQAHGGAELSGTAMDAKSGCADVGMGGAAAPPGIATDDGRGIAENAAVGAAAGAGGAIAVSSALAPARL